MHNEAIHILQKIKTSPNMDSVWHTRVEILIISCVAKGKDDGFEW